MYWVKGIEEACDTQHVRGQISPGILVLVSCCLWVVLGFLKQGLGLSYPFGVTLVLQRRAVDVVLRLGEGGVL